MEKKTCLTFKKKVNIGHGKRGELQKEEVDPSQTYLELGTWELEASSARYPAASEISFDQICLLKSGLKMRNMFAGLKSVKMSSCVDSEGGKLLAEFLFKHRNTLEEVSIQDMHDKHNKVPQLFELLKDLDSTFPSLKRLCFPNRKFYEYYYGPNFANETLEPDELDLELLSSMAPNVEYLEICQSTAKFLPKVWRRSLKEIYLTDCPLIGYESLRTLYSSPSDDRDSEADPKSGNGDDSFPFPLERFELSRRLIRLGKMNEVKLTSHDEVREWISSDAFSNGDNEIAPMHFWLDVDEDGSFDSLWTRPEPPNEHQVEKEKEKDPEYFDGQYANILWKM